jgi:DNA mismatch endonuclease (patch repair protein)
MERALREKLEGGTFQNVPVGHSGRMRAIKDRGNKSTEARIRAKLVRAGIRGWRMHPEGLPGKPDILFPRQRVVVFVDGCYWHGCPCCVRPRKVNSGYWTAKIEGNRRRDANNTRKLEEQGYRVVRVWEHELKEPGAGDWLHGLREAIGEMGAGERADRHAAEKPGDGKEADQGRRAASAATTQHARLEADPGDDSGHLGG